MIPSLIFLGFLAFSQAQTCVPATQPIGSFGQGVPRIDGTMIQKGSPYSMIDIDGAAQMPAGVITGLEFRVFRVDRVTFQVWRPLDILKGRFKLMATVELNPTDVEQVIEIRDLFIPVQSKDRWGFTYNGNGLDVPIKYSVALNEPNEEPYMAFECMNSCATGKQQNDEATFPLQKVQKQFRMRALMSIVTSTCAPDTQAPPVVTATAIPTPKECVPPTRQTHPEQTLRDGLFEGYNPSIRPRPVDENLRVDVHPRLMELIDFDGHYLNVLVILDQVWKDDYLVWCPEDHAQIKSLKLKPSEIWIPDLYPYLHQKEGPDMTKMATVQSDGTAQIIPTYVWRLRCMMTAETEETKDFNCSTKFGPWVYDGEHTDFRVPEGELDLGSLEENPKITVLSTRLTREDLMYVCCPGTPYPTLYLNIMIRYTKTDKDMDKDMDSDRHAGQ